MSNVSKRRKEGSRAKIKSMGDHKEFLKRITKTLYYAQLPTLPCLSLPVTEISCEVWSEWQRGRSLRRLHADAAAGIARGACVSPCALVLALLYLERLNACNPDYLTATAPADLFLVSLMVSNKFLQDDGEDDEVICSEWAASGGLELGRLKRLELDFLGAIDWNVFVSDESFEAGLARLERRVALRQAQARGFFTYTDLAVSTDAALLAALAQALRAAVARALLACLALLASALLVHACLPSPAPASPPAPAPAPATQHPALARPHPADLRLRLRLELDNATLSLPALGGVLDAETVGADADALTCCSGWARRVGEEGEESEGGRGERGAAERWWSGRGWAVARVYRSWVAGPLRRWLERLDEYAELARRGAARAAGGVPCGEDARCVRQWLNLSKLGALVTSVSDR